ncbi:MAG: hypothetical protein EZS28_023293, partial [Streblomastix strix]
MQRLEQSGQSAEISVIFVGRKSSGKTTIRRWISEGFNENAPNKSVPAEYSYIRTIQDNPAREVITNLYEITGGPNYSNEIDSFMTWISLPTTMFVIVLDLSKPWSVFSDLIFWMDVVEQRVKENLVKLEENSPLEATAIHNNISSVTKSNTDVIWCGIPIFIFATHYDEYESKINRNHQKELARAIRFVAARHHASVAFISTASATNQKAARSIQRTTNEAFHLLQHFALHQPLSRINICTDSSGQLLFQSGQDQFLSDLNREIEAGAEEGFDEEDDNEDNQQQQGKKQQTGQQKIGKKTRVADIVQNMRGNWDNMDISNSNNNNTNNKDKNQNRTSVNSIDTQISGTNTAVNEIKMKLMKYFPVPKQSKSNQKGDELRKLALEKFVEPDLDTQLDVMIETLSRKKAISGAVFDEQLMNTDEFGFGYIDGMSGITSPV